MFLQNERGLGVKNGTLGTILEVSAQSMTVRTDDGRNVSFDLKDYDRIDYGYTATIHKAQCMTVDRTHVLATPGLDAHSIYVARPVATPGGHRAALRDATCRRSKCFATESCGFCEGVGP